MDPAAEELSGVGHLSVEEAPERVAEHDGLRSAVPALLGGEEAPRRGGHAEQGEEVRGDPRAGESYDFMAAAANVQAGKLLDAVGREHATLEEARVNVTAALAQARTDVDAATDAPIAARWSRLAPAMKKTESAAAAYTPAVPRSGSSSPWPRAGSQAAELTRLVERAYNPGSLEDRMDYFNYLRGELRVEDVPAAQLARTLLREALDD